MNTMNIKNILLISLASVGGFIASLLGGWDELLSALIICMVVDYLTGVLGALFFQNSPKTQNGGLSSEIGAQGICKKISMIAVVAMCVCIDNIMGVHYVRNLALVFFIANEGLSVIENMGRMGIKYPTFLKKALEALKEKGDAGDE